MAPCRRLMQTDFASCRLRTSTATGTAVRFFVDANSSFVSPRGEAGSQYSFRYIYISFDVRQLSLDGAFNNNRILAFFVVYDLFLLSNYDLQNIMFVLNSWHYFKLNKCQIEQLQLNSLLPCPSRSMGTMPAPMRSPCIYIYI